MTSFNFQAAFGGLQNTLVVFAGACEIGFKEIGTGVNAANDKIEKLEIMIQDLTSLVKTQQEKITKKEEKEEGEALMLEVSGQIMIKRIPSRMKAIAHEKLRVDSADQFEWLSTTPEGEYTTLWIKHDSKSIVRNAIRMKLNWERELPLNSRDRKSVSSIIIEQVAPRSFTPLLSKLRSNLVSMREEGRASTSFVQNIRYEASSGTLAYIYQERTVKPTRATVLGYVANRPLEGREFENVPWYDTRTGQLQGRFNERPGAAAANGAKRKTAQRKPDNKHPQFASGSNRQPIIERGGGDSQHTYPEPHREPATPHNYYNSNRNQRKIDNINTKGKVTSRPTPKFPMPKLKLQPKHEDDINKPNTWISTSYLLIQDEITKMNTAVIYGEQDEPNPEVITLRMQIDVLQQDKCPISLKEPTRENTNSLIEIMKREMNVEPDLSLYHWMSELHSHDPRRRILTLALNEKDDISAQLYKLGSSKSSIGAINTLLHSICRSLLQYQATPSNFLQIKMEAVCRIEEIFNAITLKINSALKKIKAEERAADPIDLDIDEDNFKYNRMRNYFLEVGCTDGQLLDKVDTKHSELTTRYGVNYADATLGEYINIFPWKFIIGNEMLNKDYYAMKNELNFFHEDDPASISEEEMDQDQSMNAKRKRSPNPETPTKPNKPAKTASSLAIENRKPTPIKPFPAEISSLEIDQTSSEYGLIDGISKLHDSAEDVNLDRAENEDEGIAAPQEPHDVQTEPLNKDNTTLSMKAASALYNKVTAAKDKFKR